MSAPTLTYNGLAANHIEVILNNEPFGDLYWEFNTVRFVHPDKLIADAINMDIRDKEDMFEAKYAIERFVSKSIIHADVHVREAIAG